MAKSKIITGKKLNISNIIDYKVIIANFQLRDKTSAIVFT